MGAKFGEPPSEGERRLEMVVAERKERSFVWWWSFNGLGIFVNTDVWEEKF
jgi:hypothetical protein